MIEFLEEEHLYLIDGVLVPSVTTVLSATAFQNKYSNIPKEILAKKSDFGNRVHKAIELNSSDGLTTSERIAFEQYQKLRAYHQFEPFEQELQVHFDNRYIGTLDMTAHYRGELVIADVKTTAKLDKRYLSYQLSMYKYAYERMFERTLAKAYVLWLPKKEIGHFIEIEFLPIEDCLKLVEEYEQL